MDSDISTPYLFNARCWFLTGVANIGLDCTSPSTDSTRRSDLVSFFAAMRAPSQSTTVFAISRGSMSNYPTSSSVPVASTSSLRRRDAPAFIKSTLPPAAVSVALPQDQPNGKILKRPNDLLLHMLRGRTVFETSNGQMFTVCPFYMSLISIQFWCR